TAAPARSAIRSALLVRGSWSPSFTRCAHAAAAAVSRRCASGAAKRRPSAWKSSRPDSERSKTMQLENSAAVVSGGASGLGLATATKIVAAGGRAVLLDINEDQGHASA